MDRCIRRALPTRERIARRAFELYTERGKQPGYALDDWLRAERELLAAFFHSN
jgi:hypothetical protein